MDWLAVAEAIVRFVVPTSLSDVFIDSEASLFLPILIYGYRKGWWMRIARRMDRWLGVFSAVCPNCGTELD